MESGLHEIHALYKQEHDANESNDMQLKQSTRCKGVLALIRVRHAYLTVCVKQSECSVCALQ